MFNFCYPFFYYPGAIAREQASHWPLSAHTRTPLATNEPSLYCESSRLLINTRYSLKSAVRFYPGWLVLSCVRINVNNDLDEVNK